ncbi:MAG: BON domain-containing protein, partial [Isosphaerales bacterium]
MKTRLPLLQSSLTALALLAGGASAVLSQDGARPAKETGDAGNVSRPEIVVLNAIRSHPVTAPYAIATSWRKGVVVLSGRVGTKQVHDVAVWLAIDSGVPFRDDLVIDTGTAAFAAQSAAMAAPAAAVASSSSPFVYPPPLMGRVDDPFFGFVPPLLSFPPWWRRQVEGPPMVRPRTVPANTAVGTAPASASRPNAAPVDGRQPFDEPPVKGQVELTVDAAGQIFLRGVVTSEEAAREIEEAARSVPGVTRVESQLQVQVVPRRAEADDVP